MAARQNDALSAESQPRRRGGARLTPDAREHFSLWVRQASPATRSLLEHAEAHVLRILDDLCGDVEAYPTAFGDDAGLASLILVGAQEHERGVLDVSISGDRDEPVILMEMLPLRAGPISVRLIEA